MILTITRPRTKLQSIQISLRNKTVKSCREAKCNIVRALESLLEAMIGALINNLKLGVGR